MPRPAGLLEPAAPRSLLGRAEEARLRAVARYVILDTPPEPAFDDITELATSLDDDLNEKLWVHEIPNIWRVSTAP